KKLSRRFQSVTRAAGVGLSPTTRSPSNGFLIGVTLIYIALALCLHCGGLTMSVKIGLSTENSFRGVMFTRFPRTSSRSCILRRRTYHSNALREDRKSTRLNSSHVATSYAVFCLKKK